MYTYVSVEVSVDEENGQPENLHHEADKVDGHEDFIGSEERRRVKHPHHGVLQSHHVWHGTKLINPILFYDFAERGDLLKTTSNT